MSVLNYKLFRDASAAMLLEGFVAKLSFQSAALPTELPGRIEPHDKTVKKRNYSKNADFYRVLGINLSNKQDQ